MSFIIAHTRLGFCWWDLLALVLLIAVILHFAIRHKKLKDQTKELEEEISTYCAEDSLTEAAKDPTTGPAKI